MSMFAELETYRLRYPEEATVVERFVAHIDSGARSSHEGHLTGSAFIVDEAFETTLFVHHAKLDKWLQPGGHCEPGETTLETARREAAEETSVELGQPVSALPFDLDIHEIPARGDVPAHLHFDVRYLFVTPRAEARSSTESHAVEWLSFDEALRRNPEISIRRPFAKITALLCLPSRENQG